MTGMSDAICFDEIARSVQPLATDKLDGYLDFTQTPIPFSQLGQ